MSNKRKKNNCHQIRFHSLVTSHEFYKLMHTQIKEIIKNNNYLKAILMESVRGWLSLKMLMKEIVVL